MNFFGFWLLLSVILRFKIRNIYLVFIPAPGTEFLKPLEFPGDER